MFAYVVGEKRQIARTRNSTFIQCDKLSTAKRDKTDAIAVITERRVKERNDN